MVAVDRKLDALTSVLTARQRAILGVKAWVAGEQADARLERMCPPHDLAEMQGITRAVAKGNTEINSMVIFLLEWVAQNEVQIHWLRSLQPFLARDKALPAQARRLLPSLPRPWDTERKTHLGYGRLEHLNEPDAATWEQFAVRLVRDIADAIQKRWQDYLQCEAALESASKALGTDVVHMEIRQTLDHYRAAVLNLVEQFRLAGHTVVLPQFDMEVASFATQAFNLDVLRELPAEKHPREWLHERGLAELEEWEKEQAVLADA